MVWTPNSFSSFLHSSSLWPTATICGQCDRGEAMLQGLPASAVDKPPMLRRQQHGNQMKCAAHTGAGMAAVTCEDEYSPLCSGSYITSSAVRTLISFMPRWPFLSILTSAWPTAPVAPKTMTAARCVCVCVCVCLGAARCEVCVCVCVCVCVVFVRQRCS